MARRVEYLVKIDHDNLSCSGGFILLTNRTEHTEYDWRYRYRYDATQWPIQCLDLAEFMSFKDVFLFINK